MDCRQVSHLKSQCEDAAVQWKSDNFTDTTILSRHVQVEEDNNGQEMDVMAPDIDTIPYHSTTSQPTA
jgi:hypothetical protein